MSDSDHQMRGNWEGPLKFQALTENTPFVQASERLLSFYEVGRQGHGLSRIEKHLLTKHEIRALLLSVVKVLCYSYCLDQSKVDDHLRLFVDFRVFVSNLPMN